MTKQAAGTGVFSGLFSIMFAFGQARGLSIEEMASVAGVSPQDIIDPDKRLSDLSLQALWALIWSGDEADLIPMHLASAAPMTVFAGLADGLIYAATLEEALEHIAQNSLLLADRMSIAIDKSPDQVIVRLTHPLDVMDDGRLSSVGVFLLKRLISEVLGVPNAISGASLTIPETAQASLFRDFFEKQVYFSQPANGLHFFAEAFGQPINYANAELFAFVRTHTSQRRNRLQASSQRSALERLRAAVFDNAVRSDYSLRSAASRANLSLRSAQRLAAQEGRTLQDIVDEVRFENAKRLLRNRDLTINAISEKLAYSDDRSFRRAFKRKLGISPSQYRASNARK